MAQAVPNAKIIVALDVEELDQARRLISLLKDQVGAFKIGKQLFTRYGPESIRMVHAAGSRVFLDLKFHDIPSTVANASREAARHGVFMFNVHALGGLAMMQQAARAARDMAAPLGPERPRVLAVTVLTSLEAQDLAPLGFSGDLEQLVVRLARLAQQAGLDGVVASPREIEAVRQACGPAFLIVTPGIRLAGAADDQKRTMTPAEAMRAGADYIVVGRPVTRAPDPVAAVAMIIDKHDA